MFPATQEAKLLGTGRAFPERLNAPKAWHGARTVSGDFRGMNIYIYIHIYIYTYIYIHIYIHLYHSS